GVVVAGRRGIAERGAARAAFSAGQARNRVRAKGQQPIRITRMGGRRRRSVSADYCRRGIAAALLRWNPKPGRAGQLAGGIRVIEFVAGEQRPVRARGTRALWL